MTGYVNIPEFGSASWKEPVANVASLPASGNNIGDARVAKATQEIYIWDGAAWQLASGSGGIVSINGDVTPAQVISGTAPMSASTALGTTTVSISQASALTNGYLSSADWTTFNNKQPAGSYATTTLNNLGTTAINADLNLGTNAISRTNYTISPQLYDEGTKTGNFTLNWANGPAQKFTINAAGPLVITLSNPVTGGTYLVRIEQGATPGTVTWPSSVKWGTVGAPVLSNATGEVDVVTLFYDGVDYRASAVIQDAPPAANYSLTNLSFAGTNEQVLALGSSGPYWATEGVKTGYPTNTVVVGRLRPSGLTGVDNVIIGPGVASGITSGTQNLIIGGNADVGFTGRSVTTGTTNTIVGLGANSTSLNATVVGFRASVSAQYTTVLGMNASASGQDGVALGSYAGSAGTSGIAVGANCATGSGIDNTVIGTSAGRSASTGANNTIIGKSAGDALTSGNSNCLLGKDAGGALTTGALNLFLGHTAGDAVTTGSNNTIIGDIAGTTALADTVIVAAGTAERFRVDSSGNMGIGTSTPNVRLEVQNTTATTNAVTNVLRVDSQSSGTPAVGIGVGIQMSAETAAGNTEVGVVLEAVTTDVTAASEDFDFVVKNMAAGAAATETLRVTSTGDTKVTGGNLSVETVGKGLRIKTGSNATAGKETGLSSVTSITVNTTAVTANSLIFITPMNTSDKHAFSVTSITAGTSFAVGFSGNYTGDMAWLIVEPA